MSDLFTFELTPWELLEQRLKNGSTLGAVRFLSAFEQEEDEALEEAFETLLQKKVTLDISELPEDFGEGELEKRLRLESKLASSGTILTALEETDPLRLYLEELARIPVQGDPVLLAQLYLEGDEAAAGKLVELRLHRAVEMACQMTGRGVLLMDLIQEASLGLWQGILAYTGGDLDAHTDWWIRQYLAKAVALQARASGVSGNMRRAMEAYEAADRRLLTRLGRNATSEELALELQITPEQAEQVEDMLRNARAMEKVRQEKPEEDPEDQLAVEDTALFQSRQRIREMLSGLSEQEAQVLSLRFGLEGGVPETPAAVGARLGMTADAVVAMEAAALAKLRNE